MKKKFLGKVIGQMKAESGAMWRGAVTSWMKC